jgi:adenylate cyclase
LLGGDPMAVDKVKRKLTAILSADVKGYSRLMGEDEVGTIRILETYRRVMSDLIQTKGGRVVDSPGDNVLAEFASVVDALESAVEIQKELRVRNADRSESRRMEFRIGINLGDVIKEGKRIYGDGVNIAARIEGLAEGGGICISGTAFDHIGKRLPVGYEYLGEQALKNIEKPVRVYRVLMEPEAAGKVIGEAGPKRVARLYAAFAGLVAVMVIAGALAFWRVYFPRPAIEPARVDKMALPLPDKPSIAVLPFVNMSEDPKQEYFSDGVTDQIITSLSKIPHLFVIASNSTFTYKGKPVKVQQVAEDLGVRYVLEGSVQKSEKKIRIRAQLIDAIDGRHLWAETYDRGLDDVFAIQDEIAGKVITSLQVKLTSGEYATAIGKSTKNLEALQLFWRAQYHLLRITKEDNALCRRYAQQAIELDPVFAAGWAELGFSHLNDATIYGPSSSREQSMKLAGECVQKALNLNPLEPKAFLLLANMALARKDYDKAIEHAAKLLEVNPNDPWGFNFLGTALGFAGSHEEAIVNIKKTMRLCPYYHAMNLRVFGFSSFFLRRYDDALWAGEKLLDRVRKGEVPPRLGNLMMTAIYSELGQEEKARMYAAEILKAEPNFSLERIKFHLPYENQSDMDRILNAARMAGIPDKAPRPTPDKPSIAVLPFANMSDDREQEFFSDGMTEELIGALAKVEGLKVISRTSAFHFKGKQLDLRTIGEKLGVEHVLEGSVRKSGNHLRIAVQLIKVADDIHLWSETYDREIQEVFAIQDDISRAVVDSLKVKLLEKKGTLFVRAPTQSMEAYELYLKGRQFFHQGGKTALECFEKASKIDPQYAVAHAAICGCYTWAPNLGAGGVSRDDVYAKAVQAVQKALELDSTLAEAHAQLGLLQMLYEWDWKTSEQSFKKALALNPGSVDSHVNYSTLLNTIGRVDEAVAESEMALKLDPYSSEANRHFGLSLCNARKYDQATVQLKRTVEMFPKYVPARLNLGTTYIAKGMLDEAIALYRQGLSLFPANAVLLGNLAFAYGLAGRTDEAGQILDKMLEASKTKYVPATPIAKIYVGLGDRDKAFEYLEKAYATREVSGFHMLKVMPDFDLVRSDPRFDALLKKMGLVE